jgi:hypothetical protein
MIQVNYMMIIVGTVLAVAFSALYYFVLNKRVVTYRATSMGKKTDIQTTISLNRFLVEFVRTFVLGLVIANAVVLLNLMELNQAILMAIWLWIGFPVVLLTGLVIHERMSAPLVAVHAGDWLVKIMIFAVLATIWR